MGMDTFVIEQIQVDITSIRTQTWGTNFEDGYTMYTVYNYVYIYI